jgi:hypothetical protein
MAGGGVGEAMLIGAITGGATSAATGGDPLKGALLGATTGGVGAGVAGAGTSAATAAGTTTATAAPTAAAAVPTAATGTTAAGSTAGLEFANAASPEFLASQGVGTSFTPADVASLGPSQLPPGTITYAPNDPGFIPTGAAGTPSASLAQTPEAANLGILNDGTGGVDAATNANFQPGTVASGTPAENPMFPNINKFYAANPIAAPAGAGALASALGDTKRDKEEEEEYSGSLGRFKYSPDTYTPYRAASGGLMDTAVARRLMGGGQLGSYSDGGQALQGPGDGMSDSIPGVIGGAQPARLADGEFVVPADVVSGIGNGSTDAGSRQLYAMMDKIREARTGRAKQAPEINPRRMMPA